jgi:hypothetical protein
MYLDKKTNFFAILALDLEWRYHGNGLVTCGAKPVGPVHHRISLAEPNTATGVSQHVLGRDTFRQHGLVGGYFVTRFNL